MLIILEGVDGAGKSTLADRLITRLGESALRMHSGPLKADPLREYEWRLRDYRLRSGTHIVADRWHVGELIYGPLYRGQSKLTAAMRKHVELYLDKLGAHRLVVTAGIGTILERLASRGEDFLEDRHVGLVWDFYNEYAHRHGWKFVGSDEILDHIIREARRAEVDAYKLQEFPSYVGPPHPRMLIVGTEAETSQWNRPANSAAYLPHLGTDGDTLLTALERLQLRDYGIVRADDNVEKLRQVLGRPHVLNIDETPSLWPRRHRDDPRRLAQNIKKELTS